VCPLARRFGISDASEIRHAIRTPEPASREEGISGRNSYRLVRMKRKLGRKGQVVIPKDIRQKLSLAEGAILNFEVEDDTILVKPEPSPEEFVERFLSVKGKKLRKRVDWKSVLDDEYQVTGR
jgi:AbrB family looped-hinge helix DNA binding protein